MGGILEEGVWFTFLRVNVSCLLPTALSAMLLVPECSSNFSLSSKDVLEKDAHCYIFFFSFFAIITIIDSSV